MPTERLTYCRICAAACGIVVSLDGEQVLKVRGDRDHPVSQGYVCSKGRGLPAWHHSPTRLDAPRITGRDVAWPELLADLADRLNKIIDTTGPDAVALYLATGLAYDSAGQVAAAQWLPSFGSTSFLTAVTVDNAPVLVAAERVTGEPMLNPIWDPTSPGLMIFVGTNPVVSHGYGTALPDPIGKLRGFRAIGGRTWVLDPRRSETAATADEHLPVLSGSDVAVLGAIARAVLSDGADEAELREHCDAGELAALREALQDYTPARAAAAADVDVARIDQLITEVIAHRGRVAMQCGTGVMMSRDGVLAEWLRWVILIATGSLDRPGGMHFHRGAIHQLHRREPEAAPDSAAGARTRPELSRVLGQMPAVALADEIEAGHIRALLITGGNPLTAFPQPDRLRRALQTLDVLAVVDVAENELTEIATHVLPATGQLERGDITLAELTALRSGMQATRPVVDAVGDRRPVWWMLASLSRAMGLPGADALDPDELTDEAVLRLVLAFSTLDPDEVFAAGSHGVETPVEHGWVHRDLLRDGRWSIAPADLVSRLAARADAPPSGPLLATRREMPWSNSVRYGAGTDRPVALVHPDTATALDLSTDRLELSTDVGTISSSIGVDPAIRPGVLSFTHGHAGANPGRLTSDRHDVDPLTTMPRASGLPVRLRPATPTNTEDSGSAS